MKASETAGECAPGEAEPAASRSTSFCFRAKWSLLAGKSSMMRQALRKGGVKQTATRAIGFIVAYKDGSTARMPIDRHTLKGGDHVARVIARERQREGTLPEGKIKSVLRDPKWVMF